MAVKQLIPVDRRYCLHGEDHHAIVIAWALWEHNSLVTPVILAPTTPKVVPETLEEIAIQPACGDCGACGGRSWRT